MNNMSPRSRAPKWAALLIPLSFLPFDAQAAGAPRIEKFELVDGPHMKNFNHLEGAWVVESHSLRHRMTAEPEWLENHMETNYRILLGGLVAINETYGIFNGHDMHGLMIRTYDPDIDEWRFQWMSVGYPHLTEQVRGRFENGIGVFYGTETNDGHTFAMRFRWKMIDENHAFWEQAYQDPETDGWEVNWTLDLRRKQTRKVVDEECPCHAM